MESERLAKILDEHRAWLANGGGCRANLCGAILRRADLRGADLRRADLRGVDLREADLREAVMSGAFLRGADLREAVMSGAFLREADLREADLRGADLSKAFLHKANLREANLSEANLSEADLSEADLSGAFLNRSVGLCPLMAAKLEILPRIGDVRGWKKCLDGVLVEVLVPDGVERSNATGRKCRARRVCVVAVHGGDVGVSLHDGWTTYRAGEYVECDLWDSDRWVECSGGIHFYLTREEAEAHLV